MVCGACGPSWNEAELDQYEAWKRKLLADEAERKERQKEEMIWNGSITTGESILISHHGPQIQVNKQSSEYAKLFDLMDESGTTPRTFSYGLTDEEVAQLRKEGKDEWYHKKVLREISGYTAAQEIPDRVYDFRKGPPYQLSSVDCKFPIHLKMSKVVATKPRKGLDDIDDEQTKQIVQSIRSKDSRFSVGFVRCSPFDFQREQSTAPDTSTGPLKGSWSQRDNSSKDSCSAEATQTSPKLASPFQYQPNLLKRKPTPSPDSVSRKHARLEDSGSSTGPAKLEQPSLSTRLPTPADSRNNSPLQRFQNGVTHGLQLCTQNLALSVESVLLRSYKVLSGYDTVTEKHPADTDTDRIELRWDASKKRLSVHDTTSDYMIFGASGIQIPLVVYKDYEDHTQAVFLEKRESKTNPTVLAAAVICLYDVHDDAKFNDMITVLKHCIGPNKVRTEDSPIFWNGKCSELRAEKNDPSTSTLFLETTEHGLRDAQALTRPPLVDVPKKKKELSKAKKEHDKKYSKQNRQKKRKLAAATKAAAATNAAADDDYAPAAPDIGRQNMNESLSTQNQTPALPSSNSTTTQVSHGGIESADTAKRTKRTLHHKGLRTKECEWYAQVFGRRW